VQINLPGAMDERSYARLIEGEGLSGPTPGGRGGTPPLVRDNADAHA
jgi:hypothetical protein